MGSDSTKLVAGVLDEVELYELADIFIQKFRLQNVKWEGMWGYEDKEEAFRDVVANIILDTSMVLDGTVPLEKWRD
jgi:hypothetical protein